MPNLTCKEILVDKSDKYSKVSKIMEDIKVLENPRRVSRYFFTEEEFQKMIQMYEDGVAIPQIARHFGPNCSKRHITAKIKEYKDGMTKDWSPEEVALLVDLFNVQKITSPSTISKYLTKKSNWMIRNKIKSMQRNGELYNLTGKPVERKSKGVLKKAKNLMDPTLIEIEPKVLRYLSVDELINPK